MTDFSKFVEQRVEEFILDTWLFRHHDRGVVSYREVIDGVSVGILQTKLDYLKEKVERIEYVLRAKEASNAQ